MQKHRHVSRMDHTLWSSHSCTQTLQRYTAEIRGNEGIKML